MLLAENAELRARLEEAEETLRAIHCGEVDALVVQSSAGPKVFTLQGLDAELNRFQGDILAQVNDAVIAVDNEQRITFFNAAAERQYGFTAAEALGRRSVELFNYRWFQPGGPEAYMAALSETGHWRGENIHVTRTGEVLYVESSVSVLHGKNGTESGRLVSTCKSSRHK